MTWTCHELLADLEERLRRLENNHLPHAIARAKTGDLLTEPHLDSTRAFVVAAYAETETFMESISLMLLKHLERKVRELEGEIAQERRTSRQLVDSCQQSLKLLLGSKLASELDQILSTKKVSQKVDTDAVFKTLRGKIKSSTDDIAHNHGLLASDLQKLFDRIGCDTKTTFITLRNELTILNTRRSQFAHSGVAQKIASFLQATLPPVQPVYLPDPQSERQLVIRIAYELRSFITGVERMLT
jgi:hypothetical protein